MVQTVLYDMHSWTIIFTQSSFNDVIIKIAYFKNFFFFSYSFKVRRDALYLG